MRVRIVRACADVRACGLCVRADCVRVRVRRVLWVQEARDGESAILCVVVSVGCVTRYCFVSCWCYLFWQ